MVEYNDKSLFINGKEILLNGLNTNQFLWHLQEMNRPMNLINNIKGKYTMPDKIHNISLVEGDKFDALLVDDKIFRYTKLNESDLEEIQEYINKYAYATALLKLNECANILGSGLNHKYNFNEQFNYISKSYDKLLENVIVTKEKGRLVESINQIDLLEGNKNYIRRTNDLVICENWKNNFEHDNIKNYIFKEATINNNIANIKFIDEDGSKYEAIYENVNNIMIKSGLNINKLINESQLVESYKVGMLKEYQQPFTIKEASIVDYKVEGNKLKLTMIDSYGNRGNIYITPNIDIKDFMRKYKYSLNKMLNKNTFEDNIDNTIMLFKKWKDDVADVSRIKNKEVVSLNNSNARSYKTFGFIPDLKSDPVIYIDPKNKNNFKLNVKTEEGKPYSLTYRYIGDDIVQDIDDIEDEIKDYNFKSKTELHWFYDRLSQIGELLQSYSRGISTKERNLKRKDINEIKEAEGVQTTDIAPKLDQDVGGLVKVATFKKRKKQKDLVTKLSKINEQDEFYNARGFIKDENGKYHFGDYYLVEGKVVHKSKLNEDNIYYIGPKEYVMTKPNDEDSNVIEMYLDDNCYDQTVIPKSWNEDKIRMLAGKISKQEGPRGDRDFIKEVEDEYDKLFGEGRLEQIKNALNSGELDTEQENNALKSFRRITGGKRPDEVYNIEDGKYTTKKDLKESDYGSEDWKAFEIHKNEFKDYYELPHGILFRDKNKPIYGVIMNGKFILDVKPIPKDGKYRTDNSTLDTIELKDEDFSPVEDFITYYVPNSYKYDAVKEGRCPYCDKKLDGNDKVFVDKYGMCQECYDNGVE